MDDEERRARQREYTRRYRERNAEKIRDTPRTPEQRERGRAASRRYYARNREKQRERRAQNREKEREYQRRWYIANRERIQEHRRDNREERLEKGRQYARENRDARLVSRMLSNHGMYPEDWARMWEAQDGRCYLGGEPLSELGARFVHLDHDHSCCPIHFSCPACRRGLACHNCNTLIGLAGDDPDRLRRIADALEAAQAAVESRKAAMSEQLILDISGHAG